MKFSDRSVHAPLRPVFLLIVPNLQNLICLQEAWLSCLQIPCPILPLEPKWLSACILYQQSLIRFTDRSFPGFLWYSLNQSSIDSQEYVILLNAWQSLDEDQFGIMVVNMQSSNHFTFALMVFQFNWMVSRIGVFGVRYLLSFIDLLLFSLGFWLFHLFYLFHLPCCLFSVL